MIDHQSRSTPKQPPLDTDAVRQTSGRGKTTDSDLFTDEEIAVEETIYDTADSLPLSSKPISTGSFHRDSVLDDRAAADSDLASNVSISKDEYDTVLQSLVRAEHWIDAQLESLSVPETNEKTNSDGFRTVDSTAFDDSNTPPEQTAKNNKDINIDTESVEANQTTLKSETTGITTSTAKENDSAVDLGRRDEGTSDISLEDEIIFDEVAPHVVVPNVEAARNETASNLSVSNADGTHDEVTHAAASDAATTTSGVSSETVMAVHTDTLHSGASDKIVLNQDVLDEDELEITGADADAAKAVLADPIISDMTSAADVSNAAADADATNAAKEILSGSGTTRADASGQAVPTAQTSDGSSQNESTSEHASTLQQREAGMQNSTVPPHDFAARYSESVPGQMSSSSAFTQTAQTKRPSSSELQDQTAPVGGSAPLHSVGTKSDTAEFSALTTSHTDAVLVANTDSHLDTAEKIETDQSDTTDMQTNSRTDRGTESGADVGTDTTSVAAKQMQANRKKEIGTRTPDTPTHAQNDTEQNAEPDEKVEVLTRKAMRGDTVAFRVWRNGTQTTLVQGTLFDEAGVSTNEKQQKTKHRVSAKTQRINKWFASRTAHVLAVSFSAILVLAAIFFGTFGLLLRGPSPALRNQTVRVLREHTISAWVPSVFLSDTELQRILLAQAGEQS